MSSSVALINIASPISLCDDEEEEEEALLVGHGDEGGGCRWVSDPEVELFLWENNMCYRCYHDSIGVVHYVTLLSIVHNAPRFGRKVP